MIRAIFNIILSENNILKLFKNLYNNQRFISYKMSKDVKKKILVFPNLIPHF
jgi:hypothetical protein